MHVLHPINRQFVRRHLAPKRLAEAPEAVRALVRQERQRRGLPKEEQIITAAAIKKMEDMMRRVAKQ